MTIQDAAPPQTEQKRTIDVHNPITGAVIGQITAAAEADVQAAVERARVAQVAWGGAGRARAGPPDAHVAG